MHDWLPVHVCRSLDRHGCPMVQFFLENGIAADGTLFYLGEDGRVREECWDDISLMPGFHSLEYKGVLWFPYIQAFRALIEGVFYKYRRVGNPETSVAIADQIWELAVGEGMAQAGSVSRAKDSRQVSRPWDFAFPTAIPTASPH
ncbi:hypothetical protein JDV02_002481 [Purpureocillium takamizusanense]|uniref:Uncharacterized protein n=1 Tax=Purpureocillium takamizusanense TaxID=2060973 RepID=A0A9Q8QB44_9HYPO|nr:uncharacterized protein JDV02_002481 [Purpureocillium takamizusanense]UNI16001.1 hypothetical protein JDV02_002481 [Purpureocillium takamizusanense]